MSFLESSSFKYFCIFSSRVSFTNLWYLFHRWKIHEACMLALGSVKSIITDSVKNGRIHFDMHGFLTSVILADLNLSGTFLHSQDSGRTFKLPLIQLNFSSRQNKCSCFLWEIFFASQDMSSSECLKQSRDLGSNFSIERLILYSL